MRVTLPKSYESDGEKRYPVIYLLHGGTGSYSTWTDVKGGDLEALTPDTEAIFVMPDAAGNPPVGVGNYVDWYNQGAFGAPQIETYHMRQLVPWIDRNYRTISDRNARATAGFSMGGHGAFHYARRYPDVIGVSASFSGAIDNTQPLLDWRKGGAAIAQHIWGDYAAQEVRWRASGTVDSAKNLSNTKLFISYGDSGSPENTYIRLGGEAVQRRLKQFNIPYELRVYPGAAHTWATAKRALGDWLPGALAFMNGQTPRTQLAPNSFSYSTIDSRYEAFGWKVNVSRSALEFSALEVMDPLNFSLIGSGTAVVQTAAVLMPNKIYRTKIEGGARKSSETIFVQTDQAGRAVVPINLGPANSYQQFTSLSDGGSTGEGPDSDNVPFTTRGTGSRFYTVKATLAPD